MTYEPKKFEHLFGLESLNDQLLKNHFALYEGYAANTNKLIDALETLEKEDKFGTLEYSEMNRRLGWEFNGMRLHELYFGNMKKGDAQLDKNDPLFAKIEKNFLGSFANFEKDFRSMAAMRGIGWVILYYDSTSDRLLNIWINEHDVGHLAGCVPLLVMDVFEHAYMLDYGIKRPDYIDAFMKVIDWNVVAERHKNAISK